MKTSHAKGFDRFKEWHQANLLDRVVSTLKRKDFDAVSFPNISLLNKAILAEIPKSASIGIGGSVTIRELGIIEKFEKRGNKVFHHWKKGLTEKTDQTIRKQEACADYYLASANAITISGDIINIDGVGNRVAAMIYGPQNVIIVAGINKIVNSIDEGIKRSKEIAGVMNAKRVEAKTPCAKTGICIDCNAPGRICRVISILQYRPWQTNISIMLVNQHLGF